MDKINISMKINYDIYDRIKITYNKVISYYNLRGVNYERTKERSYY